MRRSSRISSKGQVTVPLEFRKRLGLKSGDRVEFVDDGGRTVIRPEQARENPFLKYAGAYPGFTSVREINDWVKSLRDEKPEKKKR